MDRFTATIVEGSALTAAAATVATALLCPGRNLLHLPLQALAQPPVPPPDALLFLDCLPPTSQLPALRQLRRHCWSAPVLMVAAQPLSDLARLHRILRTGETAHRVWHPHGALPELLRAVGEFDPLRAGNLTRLVNELTVSRRAAEELVAGCLRHLRDCPGREQSRQALEQLIELAAHRTPRACHEWVILDGVGGQLSEHLDRCRERLARARGRAAEVVRYAELVLRAWLDLLDHDDPLTLKGGE